MILAKYDKLSDGAKQVFRKMLLSDGTELVLNIVEHKKDLPGEEHVESMMAVIYALMWDEGLKYMTRNDKAYYIFQHNCF